MTELTVNLGGQSYELKPLPIRESKAWRQKFATPFERIVAVLSTADQIKLDNGADLAALLSALSGTLIGSTDIIIDMLFDYSPALQADRERIEATATDAEALTAFVQVLKAAYPFGSLLAIVSNGLAKSKTSKK